MEIQVELSRIIINETVDQQVIVLKEMSGQRSFPIVIGMAEILAIDRRIKGIDFPRPMTHDLVSNIITSLGARISKVVISDILEHTFYARIHLTTDSTELEIDSRPSDAIAITAGTDVPLFVDEIVFEKMQM